MNIKGIILAGGAGSRLSPVTKSVNKQLLPIYNKPMIFYPLSVLMLGNIKNILIVVNKGQKKSFNNILGDGSDLGIRISYIEQDYPKGLPDAFILGEQFIKKSNIALILGDNFFYGSMLSPILKNAFKTSSGAKIFLYPTKNPSSYGIVELDKRNKIKKILEKPKVTNSNLAITGLYIFDNNAVKYSKQILPSKRKELEIVDLINIYKKKNNLKMTKLGRGSAWLDVGTFEDLHEANNFVQNVEKRQNYQIACIEEISLSKKWITKKNIKSRIKFYGNSSYSKYLKTLIV